MTHHGAFRHVFVAELVRSPPADMSEPKFTDGASYKIQIRGHVGQDWSEWFSDLKLAADYAADGTPITVLSGPIPDQAALHGVLARIRDMGLQLISVGRIEESDVTGDGELREGS